MTKQLSLHTAYPVFDYELVIRPPEEVRHRIDSIRQRFFARCQNLSWNLSGRNHIVLARFSQYAMHEEKLLPKLERVVATTPPFRLFFENYGALRNQSVFMAIKENGYLEKLIANLKAEKHSFKVVNHEPVFASIPKLIMVQKLNPASFQTSWQYFEHKQMHSHFVADNVLLLRRRQDEKNWQILHRFTFENQPQPVMQGVLFA